MLYSDIVLYSVMLRLPSCPLCCRTMPPTDYIRVRARQSDRVEDRRKRGQKPALVCFHRRPQLTMSCMQCRRPSLTAKATAQSRADQAKALRDALYKMSDTLVGSLVVVTVVDPKVQAAAKPAPTKGEFDQCFECAPDGSTSPIPTLSPSGTSWSSIAT